jgi:hypothetical protein
VSLPGRDRSEVTTGYQECKSVAREYAHSPRNPSNNNIETTEKAPLARVFSFPRANCCRNQIRKSLAFASVALVDPLNESGSETLQAAR